MNKEIFMLCKSLKEEEITDTIVAEKVGNIKYDGERIIAIKISDDVMLMNKGGNVVNINFREVVDDLKKIDDDFIIDGEIISRDDDFTKLMTRARVKNKEKLLQREKDVPINYMVFDIIKLGNKDVRNEKLKVRFDILKNLMLKYNDTMDNVEIAEYGNIADMLQRAKDEKREGIIIKDWNGVYESRRSDYWVKVKFFKEEEFKAIGYEINNAGIKVRDSEDRTIQISGEQHNEVKDLIDLNGEVMIEIQYLTKSKEGRYRFPSYKRVKDGI